MQYRKEIMSPTFTKHVMDFDESQKGMFNTAIHHFVGPDNDFPHDHPFSINSHILKGSYIERVYHIEEDGSWWTEDILREEGTVNYVKAGTIHEIIELPEEECWTMAVLGPHEKPWGHWKFTDDGIFYRKDGEQEFNQLHFNQLMTK